MAWTAGPDDGRKVQGQVTGDTFAKLYHRPELLAVPACFVFDSKSLYETISFDGLVKT